MTALRNIYFLIIFSLLALQINSYIYAIKTSLGYEIRDLYSKNTIKANSEALSPIVTPPAATAPTTTSTSWAVSSASPWGYAINQPCNGLVLVGGYATLGPAGGASGQYYYKTYNNIAAHRYIFFSMTVYAIDAWNYPTVASDRFSIVLAGVTITGPQYSAYSFYKNYCGAATNDLANIRVFGAIDRGSVVSGSVQLSIYDYINANTAAASVAFRDINLLFMDSTTSSLPGALPYSCIVSDIPPSSGACSCKEGMFLSGGVCTACNSLCASCFGAGASQCYQCRPGASLVNNACTACSTGCSICHGTTETDCDACLDGYLLYNDNSCVLPCNYPLNNGTDPTTGTIPICTSPCAATPTNFLYWDQSCNATCNPPLQQNTLIKFVKTCTFPCLDNEFLFWDGSCSATCKEPLLQGTYKSKFFCYYTCPTTQYLYWNGTCIDKCMFPFKIQTSHGRQFCVHICDGAQYLYWNGSCAATCPSPLTSKIVDGNLYCDYGCLPTEFLYWDQSCELTCPYPLTTEIQGTVKPRQFCHYLGAVTNYLFWNATYPSTCPFPLTKKIYKQRNFCIYPCKTGEILFWNTTCLPLAECTNGLLVRSEPGALFCDYPCAPNQHLYWDFVCDTGCPAPLTESVMGGTYPRYWCNFGNCAATEKLYWNSSCLSYCGPHYTTTIVHTRELCHFPCDFTEFLYYDGSCKLNCPLPYAPRYQAEMNYCDYPCLSTQYLYQNGSCLYSCDFPMLYVPGPYSERYCNPPCSDPLKYYNVETQSCQATCKHDAKIENITYLRCMPYVYVSPQGFMDVLLTASADPRAPSFISWHKLSQYVRFVDIDRPARLQRFVTTQANTIVSWDLGFRIPDSLARKVTQRAMPDAFEETPISSSFMVNFWSEIIFFSSIFVLTCLIKLLEKAAEVFEWNELSPALAKIRTIFLWNFCFLLIGYYGDNIVLYTCVDLISMNLDSTPATVSLFLSMSFLVLLIGVLALNVFVLYQYRKLKHNILVDSAPSEEEEERLEEFHTKWNSCLIFYREFRDDTWYQQSFYVIYVLRMVIPMFFIALTNKFPLAQTIFELIVSILILTFIIWKQPLKKTINHVQLLCYEVGTIVIALSALILAALKPSGAGDQPNSHVRTFLGDLIILGNVYLNITAVVFWVLKVAFEIKNLYTFYKGKYSTERAPWVRLLVILLQQPGFGFEEMLQSNTIDTVPSELAKTRRSLTLEKEKIMAMNQRNSRRIFPAPTPPPQEYEVQEEPNLAPQNYANFTPLQLGSPLDLSRISSNKSVERFRSSMRRMAQPTLQVQDQIILEDPEEAEMPGASEMIHSPVDVQIPGTNSGSGSVSRPDSIPRNGYESNRRSRVVSHYQSGTETPITLAEALKKYG